MRLIFLAAVLLSIACSMFQVSPEEKALQDRAAKIPIASAITVTELAQYTEFGPVSCEQDTSFSYGNGGAEEVCRSDLKIQAARLPADLIIIEARDMAKCTLGEHLCVFMHGRAYKKTGTAADTKK